MIFPYMPILAVDVLGALAMIVIAAMALHKARQLREKAPDNMVYLYLMWICSGFTIFAVSRSFGHIVKQLLILSSNNDLWQTIGPYSGTINTVSFMLVGLITLFFKQSWNINRKMLRSQRDLEATHLELVHLNQNLEHKVVERTEMLSSSEHKCRRIFEQSLDTILVTDSQWRIIEINPAGTAMTGYTKPEIIKDEMHMGSLFANSDEWMRLEEHINTHEFVLNQEALFTRPSGETQLVMITCGVDYGAFGCQKTYHFIIKNINDKKMREKQMAQAEKLAALGELSAGLAHEINNPLGIILGYTQLMLKDASKGGTTNIDDLKIIEKHVHSCKAVVSDLLTFARKTSSDNSPVDISQLIDNVVKFLGSHQELGGVKIILDHGLDHEQIQKSGHAPERKLTVNGNEQELRQVMTNLLINAGHAVEKNGLITIKTRANNQDQILISVSDNGCGIGKKDLPKIFNPFFTTKPVSQGTGLGLSVSYGIISNHGGDITVKSTPGKGSEFTVILPRPSKLKGGK